MAGTGGMDTTASIATVRAGIMVGTAAITMAGTSTIGITGTIIAATITGAEPRFHPIGIDSKPALRHIAPVARLLTGPRGFFRTRDPLFFGSWICRPARGQEGAVLNSRT